MPAPKKTLKMSITKETFPRHLQRYIETKSMADEAATRLRKQRDDMIAYVAKRGIVDDKGNAWIEAEGLGRVKRERRVSNVFDSDAAEAWLQEHGGDLWEECTTTITVIDEDTLLAKIYDETIPDEVASAWYTEKETFALKVEEFG